MVRKTEQATVLYCPFSWVVHSTPPGCLGALFGAGRSEVTEPKPCMGSSCMLWDREHNNCYFVTGFWAILQGQRPGT